MNVRLALLAFAAVALSGCINWQAGYDNWARSQCLRNPDETARRACLDQVEADRQARRDAKR